MRMLMLSFAHSFACFDYLIEWFWRPRQNTKFSQFFYIYQSSSQDTDGPLGLNQVNGLATAMGHALVPVTA